MAHCPRFPPKVVRELLRKTDDTGREHGAVMCSTGEVTDIVSGGEESMNIGEAIRECPRDGEHHIIHTHPNGSKRLSPQDRRTAMADDVASVCVAVEGGEVRCETLTDCVGGGGGATCDIDTCEQKVSA